MVSVAKWARDRELRLGAHYRNPEAKDFEKVYTVVYGAPNYPFLAEESHQLAEEYISADDVIAFCFYLTNKMRRNLIKNEKWNEEESPH